MTQRRSYNPDDGLIPYRGVESTIVYNNLYLNDSRYIERYKIEEVSGIDDADVRDVREENPDSHGELAFNSFYGGRTITLRGKIFSGNYSRLKRMISNFKSAFMDLEEEELSFLSEDWDEIFIDDTYAEDFSIAPTTGHAVNTSLKNLVITGSTLTSFALNFKGTMGPDLETIQPIKIGGTCGANFHYINGAKATNNLNYIGLRLLSNSIQLAKNVNGTISTLGSSTVNVDALNANTTYWTRFYVNGNDLVGELWIQEPKDNLVPIASTTHTLAGGDIASYGTGVRGFPVFNLRPQVTDGTYMIGTHSVRHLNPGDVSILSRKVGKIDIPDKQDTLKVDRDFLLTLRSSTPQFLSRGRHIKTSSVDNTPLTFPATGGLTFPSSGVGIYFGVTDRFTVTNMGNFINNPVFKLQGTCADPIITNKSTGSVFKLSGVSLLSATSYVLYDMNQKSVTDNNGNNLYQYGSAESKWLELLPGDNIIAAKVSALSGTVMSTTPTLNLYYRNSWL